MLYNTADEMTAKKVEHVCTDLDVALCFMKEDSQNKSGIQEISMIASLSGCYRSNHG